MIEIAIIAMKLLSPLVTAAVGWAATQLARQATAKTGSTLIANAIEKLNFILGTVVSEIEQTVVAKAREVSKSGKLDQAAIDEIKGAAMLKARTYLTQAELERIARLVGVNKDNVWDFVSGRIETLVRAISGKPVLTPVALPEGAGGSAPGLPPFTRAAPAA